MLPVFKSHWWKTGGGRCGIDLQISLVDGVYWVILGYTGLYWLILGSYWDHIALYWFILVYTGPILGLYWFILVYTGI